VGVSSFVADVGSILGEGFQTPQCTMVKNMGWGWSTCSKHKALNSNPSTTKIQNKTKANKQNGL
jgi:hypothetical protein